MTSIQCVITAAVENGLRVAAHDVCAAFADRLAEKGMLNCKAGEAMALLATLEITTKRSAAMKKVRAAQKSVDGTTSTKPVIRKKPEMVIPFCGEVEESWCKAVRFNHGLHTQCTNGPCSDKEYCKTCQKGADNSASSKPTYGDIRDRAKTGSLEYRDPKGKLTTCYANVAKKQGLDLTRAQEIATAFGWTIPAEQLIETATKRGRPASATEKKKTVKKTKKAVVKKSNSMDDQIAQLVAEAASEVLGEAPVKASVKAKASIKVKAKKVKAKKPVNAEQVAEKKAVADLKAAEQLIKQQQSEAKKVAAAELKEQKAAEKLIKQQEREAKKVATAELKEQKAAEKLIKQQERESKKVAAAELKAKKAAEKLLKQQAAAELKATKEKDRLASLEKKALAAAAAAAFAAAVTTVDSSGDELEAEDVTEEEIEPIAAAAASDEDEDEEELELNESMKVTIGSTEYFKTPAFGLAAVLFSYPTGETVGAYDEATGEIQEIEFDED